MSRTMKTLLAAVLVAGGSLVAVESASAQVVSDTGTQVSGLTLDLATGRVVVQTNQNVVNLSALDPNRNVIDPGSLQAVDYHQFDASGVLWHYSGYRWRSFGIPHSQISRRSISGTGIGGVAIQQTQTQSRSKPNTSPRRPVSAGPNFQPRSGGAYGQW